MTHTVYFEESNRENFQYHQARSVALSLILGINLKENGLDNRFN